MYVFKPIDWLIDYVISLCQIAYAAPHMSGSLFFIYSLALNFLSHTHWAILLAFLFFVALPSPSNYYVCSIFIAWCFWHILFKFGIFGDFFNDWNSW